MFKFTLDSITLIVHLQWTKYLYIFISILIVSTRTQKSKLKKNFHIRKASLQVQTSASVHFRPISIRIASNRKLYIAKFECYYYYYYYCQTWVGAYELLVWKRSAIIYWLKWRKHIFMFNDFLFHSSTVSINTHI